MLHMLFVANTHLQSEPLCFQYKQFFFPIMTKFEIVCDIDEQEIGLEWIFGWDSPKNEQQQGRSMKAMKTVKLRIKGKENHSHVFQMFDYFVQTLYLSYVSVQ